MEAWDGERPAELPPLRPIETLRGGLRLAGFGSLTLLTLGVFLLGRALRAAFGRWVTFHFCAARLWSRAGLWFLGLRLEVEGEPVRAGALVANHSSWIDILPLRAVRLIYFVSKADVASWPGLGFIARVTGTVFIERKRTEAKRQETVLRERIAARQLLCFFPEGTSTDGLRVLPFKSSLFSAFFLEDHGADLWVQPVSVRYHPGPGLPPCFYGWWGSMPFESHLWNALARGRGGRVRVVFHPPVRPADFADRKSLAEHCARRVTEGHAA